MLLSLLSRRTLEADSRDSYGFTVRPQHLNSYREYDHIYKEEEEERSEKWRKFIENCGELVELCSSSESTTNVAARKQADALISGSSPKNKDCASSGGSGKEVPAARPRKIQTWIPIRPSLSPIEKMMASRVKKRVTGKDEHALSLQKQPLLTGEQTIVCQEAEEEHGSCKAFLHDETKLDAKNNSLENHATWKEELEFLVQGGVPKPLRGEVWQAFIGVQTRRVERYYQNLVSSEMDPGGEKRQDGSSMSLITDDNGVPEKLKKQIEKDLCRTFPGHPALDDEGRNSLRRVLTAYARHNPSVGYCQAMNFFAGLFLFLMPEENAFWALVGIIDNYFDGYYTYEMIESQVDQLVFEELVRQRFPKLVNHLDYLGVQVTWISSPWFLSIFMNMLPWETVLRVWDVLLFEGNRVMLFRVALALMELYAPVIVTTTDAGEAIALLQSLAGATFDSSQLVITASLGFLAVTEDRLKDLRNKHRPSVLGIIEERTRGNKVSKESKSIATKLSSFKHGPQVAMKTQSSSVRLSNRNMSKTKSIKNFDDFISSISSDPEDESDSDLREEVVSLKAEISNLLEEKRLVTLRAEELENAFMEMDNLDDGELLHAKVEQLEQEFVELQQVLADKQQQEKKILEALMSMEQGHKATEDARLAAEQEAASQRHNIRVLQEKYDKTLSSLAEMEKKAVVAESMHEATLQYETSQAMALSSPSLSRQHSPDRSATKTSSLKFGLGWLDKSKAKPSNMEGLGESA